MRAVKTGVVGTGNISDVYLSNAEKYDVIDIVALCDLDIGRAGAKAEKYGIKKVYSTVDELVSDSEIEAVLNLTNPAAHFAVNMAALEAGKHVYTEKTLAATFEEGRKTIEYAAEKNLRVGVAPDTFMSGRLQMCRKILDSGSIGKPVAATGFFAYPGHEAWHPDPFYYYKKGAGPVFDEGPYWITALVSLLGPAVRVSGAAMKTYDKRIIGSKPHFGETIDVEVPTHISGNIEFACGAIATVILSFDLWDTHLPRLEVYCTKGSVSLPEADPLGGPNMYGGPLLVRTDENSDWKGYEYTGELHGSTPWEDVSYSDRFGYNAGNCRILGFADMCAALQTGRPHRASGEMGLHVLEILESLLVSAETGKYCSLETTFSRPEIMPENVSEFVFEK